MLSIIVGVFMEFKECGNSDGRIFFEWNITNYCNYDCYYCSVADTMKSDPVKNHQADSYKLVIARLKLVKKPFSIDLAGGEPTLHKEINYIIQELQDIDNCLTISITTNFTKSIKFFENIENLNLDKVDLEISYHPEYHNIYLNNLDKLKRVVTRIPDVINVISTDKSEYWDNTLSFIKVLDDNDIGYALTILHSTSNYKVNYDMSAFNKVFGDTFARMKDRDTNFINTFKYDNEHFTYNEVIMKGLDKLKGISCDSYYYSINIDGTFTRICTGDKLSFDMSGVDTTVICPHDTCNCESRLTLNKRWI